MDTCLGILGPKMGPMFRDSLSKTDPFGRHIPVYRFYGSTPRGYEFLGLSCTPRQTQMRVCHPTLFQKLRAFDPCLFAK